jgi:hypothetical protein
MQRFLENKVAFFTVAVLFALAVLWNLGHGVAGSSESHGMTVVAPSFILLTHGASAPPDPWDGVKIAHGASAPPDPWDGVKVAHGASAPPDPWDGVKVAHGASAPPDPWDGVKVAHGASAPPDPWDGLTA